MQQKVGVGYMINIFANFRKVKTFEKQKLFFKIFFIFSIKIDEIYH